MKMVQIWSTRVSVWRSRKLYCYQGPGSAPESMWQNLRKITLSPHHPLYGYAFYIWLPIFILRRNFSEYVCKLFLQKILILLCLAAPTTIMFHLRSYLLFSLPMTLGDFGQTFTSLPPQQWKYCGQLARITHKAFMAFLETYSVLF